MELKLRIVDVLRAADWGAALHPSNLGLGGIVGVLLVLAGLAGVGVFIWNLARRDNSLATAHLIIGTAALLLGLAATWWGTLQLNSVFSSVGGMPDEAQLQEGINLTAQPTGLGALVFLSNLGFMLAGLLGTRMIPR